MTPTGSAAGNGGGGPTGSGVCVSGVTWTGGEEGPHMNPGQDCVGCHASSGGEAPRFAFAGTIYTNYDEPDDCYGAQGASVTITDAAGHSWTTNSNSAGNFFFYESQVGSVTWPITAEVTANGATNVMTMPQSSGACNSCHTAAGSGGAPGRVVK